MIKLKNVAFAALVAVMGFGLQVSAQFQNPNIEYFGPANEMYLAGPNPNEGTQIIPVGIDLYAGNDNNTIHYGLTPPNSSSKPVVVFVHGYASNASVFYTGDDNMYKDVYQDGYRSAYVSLTPDKHIWTNGNMLADIIDRICLHYGVNDVVLVGWSKGGVDSDAAMVHFGANAKVSEAFTLSTPHHGTYLGELANSWLLSLVNIIFMQNNDATRSLTRGYMSYFRSVTDGNPANNTGFTTLGGWGNGPLNRLDIPQGILHLNGGSKASGGNDGVVPYSSSKRPGGSELFGGQYKAYGWFGIPYYPGPSQTKLDHFEVTRGGKVWPFIKGTLNGTLRTAVNPTPVSYDASSRVSSNGQLVTSDGSSQFFVVEEGAQTVLVQILGEKLDMPLIRDEKIKLCQLRPVGERLWEMEAPQPGRYTIELMQKEQFAALVSVEQGAELTLESPSTLVGAGEAMQFEVGIDGMKKDLPDDLEVTGILRRSQQLDLQEVDGAPMVIRFEREGNQFLGESMSDLPAGVYSLTVSAHSPEFARTLVSSFAKLGHSEEELVDEVTSLSMTRAWPNPFSDRLSIEVEAEGAGELTIYNVLGKAVKSMTFSGQEVLHWDARTEGAPAGVYIVELRSGDRQTTQKVILK